MYGNEVKKDLLGNPIPDAVPFSMTPNDPNAATANGHGGNIGSVAAIADNIDKNKKPETEEQMLAEHAKIKAEVERHYPSAAKNIPNVDPTMGRAAIEAARDEAKKVQMEEEGKELQQKLAGVGGALLGLSAVASGMALLEENSNQKSSNPNSRLASVVDDPRYAEMAKIFERNPDGISSAGKGLLFGASNPLTENRGELGTLALSAELPKLVAAAKTTDRSMAL